VRAFRLSNVIPSTYTSCPPDLHFFAASFLAQSIRFAEKWPSSRPAPRIFLSPVDGSPPGLDLITFLFGPPMPDVLCSPSTGPASSFCMSGIPNGKNPFGAPSPAKSGQLLQPPPALPPLHDIQLLKSLFLTILSSVPRLMNVRVF